MTSTKHVVDGLMQFFMLLQAISIKMRVSQHTIQHFHNEVRCIDVGTVKLRVHSTIMKASVKSPLRELAYCTMRFAESIPSAARFSR